MVRHAVMFVFALGLSMSAMFVTNVLANHLRHMRGSRKDWFTVVVGFLAILVYVVGFFLAWHWINKNNYPVSLWAEVALWVMLIILSAVRGWRVPKKEGAYE